MKVKETRISISHSSQFTDFLVCCSNRSDSVFSFSKFRSAWRIDWLRVWEGKENATDDVNVEMISGTTRPVFLCRVGCECYLSYTAHLWTDLAETRGIRRRKCLGSRNKQKTKRSEIYKHMLAKSHHCLFCYRWSHRHGGGEWNKLTRYQQTLTLNIIFPHQALIINTRSSLT